MTYTEDQYNAAIINAAAELQAEKLASAAALSALTEQHATAITSAVAAIQSQLDAANAKATKDAADFNAAIDVNLTTIAQLTTARDAAIAEKAALRTQLVQLGNVQRGLLKSATESLAGALAVTVQALADDDAEKLAAAAAEKAKEKAELEARLAALNAQPQ
jgi:hypothetical protein